ncbi:MAG: hypothetical protein ACXW4B_11440 [Micavibrio sp.]
MSTDPHNLSQSLHDMKVALQDAAPGLHRFLAAAWNLCMKSLIAIKAMPFIVKMPWLLVVLAILLIVICSYLILLITPLAYIAITRKANAAQNFLIPLDGKDAEFEDIDQTGE